MVGYDADGQIVGASALISVAAGEWGEVALWGSGIESVLLRSTDSVVVADTLHIEVEDTPSIPEPASMVLLGLGLAGVALRGRKHF